MEKLLMVMDAAETFFNVIVCGVDEAAKPLNRVTERGDTLSAPAFVPVPASCTVRDPPIESWEI